jgi:hypothetical protein
MTIAEFEVDFTLTSILAALVREAYLVLYLVVALLARLLVLMLLAPKFAVFSAGLALLLLACLQDHGVSESTAALAMADETQ